MRVSALGQFIDGNRLSIAQLLEDEDLRSAEAHAALGLAIEESQRADDSPDGIHHKPGIIGGSAIYMGSHIY